MLGWFHSLMPREEKFFDLFEAHSQQLIAGAQALDAMLRGGPDEIPRHCQTIMARENDADGITRQVLIAIRRTFITPFDRGDIKNLITAMDDAIDQMQQTAKAVTLFEVTRFEPAMVEIGGAVVECARAVADAVPLLRQIDKQAARIGTIAESISAIENRADELHDRGLKELFRRHAAPDEMTFIIGSAIYDNLEGVVDRFDDIGNEINSVVIEHV